MLSPTWEVSEHREEVGVLVIREQENTKDLLLELEFCD